MIKMLGVDLDGTCLNSDIELPLENKKALEAAIEKGVIVIPTTGRTLNIIPEEILEIPGIKYAITSNGAAVYNLENKRIIHSRPIPKESLKAIFDVLNNYDLLVEVYINGIDYIKESQYKKIKEIVPENYWDLFLNDTVSIPDEELDSLIETQDVEKMNFRIERDKLNKLKEILEILKPIPGLELVYQAEGSGEITSSEASKAEGLAVVANMNGIDCSQIVAIGDSNNDLPMISFAGTGVAMGQAEDHVKEYAQYVTATNDENGVALAIENLILNDDSSVDFPKEHINKLKKVNHE